MNNILDKRKQVKRTKGFLFILSALALIMTSCEMNSDDYKTVDNKLHGTWERNEQTYLYKGQLVLGSNAITITGSFAYLKGLTRNVALEAYSELTGSDFPERKGLLYIKDRGAWKNPVSFIYWETADTPKKKMLTFTGGALADETLIKIAE